MLSFVVPFFAAGIAPLAMSIGFAVWGEEWKGSAFALNCFKCSSAGGLFLLIALAESSIGLSSLLNKPSSTLFPLILSSLLGIVVGDSMWLGALQMLGARQTLLVDSLKPLFSILLAAKLLNEQLNITMAIGALLTCGGVAVVCLERNQTNDNSTQESATTSLVGFSLAFGNVLLDVIGSVLTRKFGVELTTWEINAVRFVSAAMIMWTLALIMREARLRSNIYSMTPVDADADYIRNEWWDMPSSRLQTESAWARITGGVFLVTFVCPALSNYALFKMNVGVALTIGSLSPIFALVIDAIWFRKPVSVRSIAATTVSFLGVALLLSQES